MKPLLVGEANPWQSDERMAMRYALHPDPPHASGGRLCFYVMGIEESAYLASFDRIDLCHPKWSLPVARAKAAQLVAGRSEAHDVIVLCGSKVAAAFGLGEAQAFTIHRIRPRLVLLPHPSGLNRLWHQPGAVARARATLAQAGVLSFFDCDACARDGSPCVKCDATGRVEYGWRCSACGIETFDIESMRRDVMIPGASAGKMACPLCHAEGQFVDAIRSARAAGALVVRRKGRAA